MVLGLPFVSRLNSVAPNQNCDVLNQTQIAIVAGGKNGNIDFPEGYERGWAPKVYVLLLVYFVYVSFCECSIMTVNFVDIQLLLPTLMVGCWSYRKSRKVCCFLI